MNRILLYCPKFSEFEEEILVAIKMRGFNVKGVFVNEYADLKLFSLKKMLLKIANVVNSKIIYSLIVPIVFKDHNRMLMEQFEGEWDKLIVIKGYGLSRKTVRSVNAKKKILYQWDPVCKFPSMQYHYHLFDKVFTYSRKDALLGYGEYLPNFASQHRHTYQIEDRKVFFIGEYTKYRAILLEQIAFHMKLIGYTCSFILVDLDAECSSAYNDVTITDTRIDRNLYELLAGESRIHLDICRTGDANKTQRYENAFANSRYLITDYQDDNTLQISELLNVWSSSELEHIFIQRKKNAPQQILDIQKWLDSLLED